MILLMLLVPGLLAAYLGFLFWTFAAVTVFAICAWIARGVVGMVLGAFNLLVDIVCAFETRLRSRGTDPRF